MNASRRLYLFVVVMVMPFVIVAAFHFTAWLGWPSLIAGGLYWLGSLVQLTEKS